jgi:hypothetical protein
MATLTTVTIDGSVTEKLGTATVNSGTGSGSGAKSTVAGSDVPPTMNFDPANHSNSNRGTGYAVGDNLQSSYKPDNTNSAWMCIVATISSGTVMTVVGRQNSLSVPTPVGGGFVNVSWANIVGTTLTVDLATGNFFEMDFQSAGSNPDTFTISNPSASYISSFVLKITQGSTARQLSLLPSKFKWIGGTIPTLTTTDNAVDILSFTTYDYGTTWLGAVVGQNYS